jgi:hypothetical protein
MGIFRDEKKVIREATETAKTSINVALVISCAALVVAGIALVVGVLR